MEQKSYRLEIVNKLLRGENHIRGLAKIININHTNIARKINKLYRENIVDYEIKGKNKVFFLKKTIEAKQYVYMTEHYKLLKLLQKYPALRKIIETIQKKNNIKLAIIFGSYAKHTAKKESDIDIYIETTNRKIKRELEFIDSKLSIKIGAYNKDNLLIKEIEKSPIIIKGIEEYYEKNKFFE